MVYIKDVLEGISRSMVPNYYTRYKIKRWWDKNLKTLLLTGTIGLCSLISGIYLSYNVIGMKKEVRKIIQTTENKKDTVALEQICEEHKNKNQELQRKVSLLQKVNRQLSDRIYQLDQTVSNYKTENEQLQRRTREYETPNSYLDSNVKIIMKKEKYTADLVAFDRINETFFWHSVSLVLTVDERLRLLREMDRNKDHLITAEEAERVRAKAEQKYKPLLVRTWEILEK